MYHNEFDKLFKQPILASATQIDKGQEYSYLADWLGDGMFLTTGASQLQHAKKLKITPNLLFMVFARPALERSPAPAHASIPLPDPRRIRAHLQRTQPNPG